MPFVMLRRDWPGNFRRTIHTGKGKGAKTKVLEFTPGVAVEISPDDARAMKSDIGPALLAVEMDEKARPRVISEEVEPEGGDAETGHPPESGGSSGDDAPTE